MKDGQTLSPRRHSVLTVGERRTAGDTFAVGLSVTAPVARGSTEPHSFEVPAVA